MKLIYVLMIMGGIILAATAWVEVADPCVRYENRGLVATTYGNRTTIEPQQVCVERRSGWKQ